MGKRTVRVISNMRNLGRASNAGFSIRHKWDPGSGTAWSAVRLFLQAFHYDVVVLNNDQRRLMVLCLLSWLFPFRRFRLVSVDILLPRPVGKLQQLIARVKRILLAQVELFILYFVDLDGYSRFYGISSDRTCYVPFKVNSWELIPSVNLLNSDGGYVFAGGRSLRDLPTFVEAMRRAGFPGLLLYQSASICGKHGTRIDLKNLPENLRAEKHNGDPRTWIEHIEKSRIVVVPILENSISATGISTYLMAMALKKCVIITEGPATRGLIRDEALIVPPRDPIALAEAIGLAWNDGCLRESIANAGRRYAERLEGENRLLKDILDACVKLSQGQ